MIIVCNKKNMPEIKKGSLIINIMRPSILSNEWSHNPNSAAQIIVKDRMEAISEYEKSFLRKVKRKGAFRDEVIRLFHLAKKQDIYLMCCCKPVYCHGDIIKKFLEKYLGDDIFIS